MERYGFYDVFLIEPHEGRIIYPSTRRSTRDIAEGRTLCGYGLRRAARQMIESGGDETYLFADFEAI